MIHWVEFGVFLVLFLVVTVLGFVASRWQRGTGSGTGTGLDHLDEWGLGGRKFGSWVTWFLVGGDLYTAYTFVAVPALLFGAGALGFYALPYTVVLYPMVFLPVLRLWSVSRVHGYVTPADFVAGRYGSSLLALLIALTGIVATMPYIALQLVGMEAVLRTMGLNATGIAGHLPLFIAFVILAVYTYQSGLRAPALIAFVKDLLIYLVIGVAVGYLPTRFGGWESIFGAAAKKLATINPATHAPAGSVLLTGTNQLQYVTLAFGSALALMLYPHSVTGVLACRGRTVLRRNMIALPAYSLLLGLLALLGYVAIAAGTKPITNAASGRPDTNTIIPVLFQTQFSPWFAGIAFAAVGIGALVPAAIMSIAAANLWTRNIYKSYLKPDATPAQQAKQAKLASLVVKFGAVAFVSGRRPAVLHRTATDRRRDHPADRAGGGDRALHPLVAPLGGTRRPAGRAGLRNPPALRHPEPGDHVAALRWFGADPRQDRPVRPASVRRVKGADLRRHCRAGRQPDGCGDRQRDPARGTGVERNRRDVDRRLPRRRSSGRDQFTHRG